MTPKISLIVATAGAVLVLGVPAAWGDDYFADRQDQAIITAMHEDGFDAAVLAAKQQEQATMLDARERSLGASVGNQKVSPLDARERALEAKHEVVLGSDFYADGFAQAVQSRGTTPDPVRDDRFRLHPSSVPSPVTVTSPGRDIEWPQIGFGFGIGIVLMLGLYLALKATRQRPLAH